MSWEAEKQNFLQQKANLDKQYSDTSIESNVSQMNAAISRYIRRGGIRAKAGTEDVDYKEATEKFQWLLDGQKEYNKLLKDMSQAVSGVTNDADIQQKLKQVGQLKDDIANLEKQLKDAKQDVNTSVSRQDSVKNTRQNVSMYQGFSAFLGITRPIHTTSIPFLIGFGILLLFFSGLMTKEFFGFSSEGLNLNVQEAVPFFQDSRFYSALSGVAFVTVFLSILAYSGYLGKTV